MKNKPKHDKRSGALHDNEESHIEVKEKKKEKMTAKWLADSLSVTSEAAVK